MRSAQSTTNLTMRGANSPLLPSGGGEKVPKADEGCPHLSIAAA
jgi:hypothetical protein